MKRLLCIMGGMNVGGAETFIMKIYRTIDRSQYQFDFCVNSPIENNYYAAEIKELGGNLYVINPKSSGIAKQWITIKEIVKQNQYRYVIKMKQHSLACIDLLAAKAGGARVLAMRSTNASSGGGRKEILHKLFSFLPKWIPTIKIAPSYEAAVYTFGKKQLIDKKVTIIYNGLNIENYMFNDKKRKKSRKNFGIKDEQFVIGHIGRFDLQKNHEFLIDIFYEIRKSNTKAILLLIGIGELYNRIREKVKNLNLDKSVIFAGIRNDVSDLLSAIDIIVFPSFYEGMPNSIIEAQTCGIPCLISDTISKQAAITDLVYFLPLKKGAAFWAKEAKKIYEAKSTINRKEYPIIIKKKGYDISDCSKTFTNLIFEGK